MGNLHLADSVFCVSTVSLKYFYKQNPQVLGGSETAHSAVLIYWILPQMSHLFLRCKISSAPRLVSGLALAFCDKNFYVQKLAWPLRWKGNLWKPSCLVWFQALGATCLEMIQFSLLWRIITTQFNIEHEYHIHVVFIPLNARVINYESECFTKMRTYTGCIMQIPHEQKVRRSCWKRRSGRGTPEKRITRCPGNS